MPICHYNNFTITILGDSPPYPVHCAYREHTAEGLFAQDMNVTAWQEVRAAISQDEPGEALLIEAGSALFSEIFYGDVRDLWLRARSDLENDDERGVRICLALSPPAVAALPWEYLYDPHRNTAFATQTRTPLVRVERAYRHVGAGRAQATGFPLRLLIAAPDDPDGVIDAETEIARVEDALQALPSARLVVRTLRGRFDMLDLRQALADQQSDILHVITHGRDDGLALWRDGEPIVASSGSLRAMMEQTPSVRLALLNACRSGEIAGPIPFTTVAQQLLQAGLPAVIAMQSDILDEDAIAFSRYLYAALAAGPCPGRIGYAVAAARGALYVRNPDGPGYGIPVLWQQGDGRLFTLPTDDEPVYSQDKPNAFEPGRKIAEAQEDGDPVPDPAEDPVEIAVDEVAAWLAQEQEAIGQFAHSLPSDRRFLLDRWRKDASELQALLIQWRAISQTAAGEGDLRQAKYQRIKNMQANLTELAGKIRLLGG
ncbi:MAG: CHAT domain-containing protein [Caldilineaceae bacterium]|nr:CHAT domain-containing protein [Caldilineaceae bacterium]